WRRQAVPTIAAAGPDRWRRAAHQRAGTLGSPRTRLAHIPLKLMQKVATRFFTLPCRGRVGERSEPWWGPSLRALGACGANRPSLHPPNVSGRRPSASEGGQDYTYFPSYVNKLLGINTHKFVKRIIGWVSLRDWASMAVHVRDVKQSRARARCGAICSQNAPSSVLTRLMAAFVR